MSQWYNPSPEDIEIDAENSQVNVFVKSNDQGNVYVYFSFAEVQEIYERVENEWSSAQTVKIKTEPDDA